MHLNQSVLNDLGYPIIQNWLKENCQSEGAKILSNEFIDFEKQDLIENLVLVQEIINSITRNEPKFIIELKIIDEWINLLRIKGNRLKKSNFEELYHLLSISEHIYNRCKKENYPKWNQKFSSLFLFEDGKKEIKKIFNNEFEIKNSASLELKKIRKNINQINNQTKKKLDSIFQQAQKNNWLNNNQLIWKDDRLMLAVDATHKRKIKGIIHSYSSTRQTAYIEPLSILEDNNKLTLLYQQESAEIYKILIKLSDFFHPYVNQIHSNYELLINFDFFISKALFAKEFNCCRPEFNNSVEIKNGKNPNLLIQKEKVIELNCSMDDHRMLLISGPNAGGKTVTIKTIGLFAIMAQQGLFIPAEKCSMPIFKTLHIDIGDRQSIENNLSTFSAHIQNLKNIINQANSDSLILLDELGSGTEPEAGTALSQSILEAFISKQSYVFVTTHMSSLKLWANEKEEIINGGMIFDNKKLEPTFILQLGLPGSSFTLEIADRLGLDKNIINRAQSLMNKDIFNSDKLIEKLEAKNQSLKKLELTLDKQKISISKKEKKLTIKEDEVNQILKNAENITSEKIKEDLITNRKKIEKLVNDIKIEHASTQSIKKAKTFISQKLDQISKKSHIVYKKINKSDIKLNEIVSIPDFNTSGTIVEIDSNKTNVVVDVKGKRLKLNINKIFINKEKKQPKKITKNISKFNVSKPNSFKIDLRGNRVDEAIVNVKLFLDQTYVSGMTFIHIIHGKGTGALQTSIHEELKNVKFIKSFNYAKPENGGTGVTIVEFKN